MLTKNTSEGMGDRECEQKNTKEEAGTENVNKKTNGEV